MQDEYQARGWLPARMNLNKGVIRGLLELVAWMFFQLYQLLEALLTQAVPLLSGGDWLDLHCDQVGIQRKAATKAKGCALLSLRSRRRRVRIFRFRRGVSSTRFRTAQRRVYRYVTLADAVVQAGEVYADVLVDPKRTVPKRNAGARQSASW